jgi:hypothetical protein
MTTPTQRDILRVPAVTRWVGAHKHVGNVIVYRLGDGTVELGWDALTGGAEPITLTMTEDQAHSIAEYLRTT